MSWRDRSDRRRRFKRKALMALLALGTVVGYGSGFAHMAARRCHRDEWRQHDCACEHQRQAPPPQGYWGYGPPPPPPPQYWR